MNLKEFTIICCLLFLNIFETRYAGEVLIGDEVLILNENEVIPARVIGVSSSKMLGIHQILLFATEYLISFKFFI